MSKAFFGIEKLRPVRPRIMNLLITVSGIALLVVGGEGLVRGAVGIARRFGLSPFIVGVTIVGFGTSAPELVVSVDAAVSGAPGIAVGNVIGSNIANMMLIVGAAALVQPLRVHPDALTRDGTVMIVATLLFVLIALDGTMTRGYGIGLVAALVIYVGFSLWWDARGPGPVSALHSHEATELEVGLPYRMPILLGAVVVGLAGLIAGSRLAVIGATGLARDAAIPDEIIGITLVAVGTSLPELATALSAARRGHSDVCVGNVIGSNIFNLLGIAGTAAIAAPLPMSGVIVGVDIWALLGITILLVGFMLTGRRVVRWEGLILLLLYLLFVTYHLVPDGVRPA